MLDDFPHNPPSDLPSFNQHGVLPPGDYAPDRASFEDRFANHNSSGERRDIYDGWNRHRRALVQSGLKGTAKQLLNGSFTTAKDMPGDLDLAVEVPIDGDITQQFPPPELAPVEALLRGDEMKTEYHCDAYPIYNLPLTMTIMKL